MQKSIDLRSRIRGSVLGSVIASEFSFSFLAKCLETKKVVRENQQFRFLDADFQPEGFTNFGRMTSLIQLSIDAYVEAKGRVTPEIYGKLFASYAYVSVPAFSWDTLHSVQEVLREGMNPRISGMLTNPNGAMCAATIGTGLFHFADPERAYLDGVELASVAQCRDGADWAAVCSALIFPVRRYAHARVAAGQW